MNNKIKEAKIFERFFNTFANEFNLNDGWEQQEKPDFIVYQNNKKIGVELTRYNIEGEEKQSALCNAVVKEAQIEYLKINSNNIQLSIDFNRDFPILNKTKFVRKLRALAVSLCNEATGQVSNDKFAQIKELRYVSLYSELDNIWPNWEVSQIHSTPNFSNTEFEKIIKKKELKSIDYEICDENWLLVSMDFMNRAQDSNVDVEIMVHHYSSIFSKIILYRTAYMDIFVFENSKIRRIESTS